MPKELNLTLSAAEVSELDSFLQELPAKYANPILNYLQSKINAQRRAEQEAERKTEEKGIGKVAEDIIPVEEMEPFVTN